MCIFTKIYEANKANHNSSQSLGGGHMDILLFSVFSRCLNISQFLKNLSIEDVAEYHIQNNHTPIK